jgi:hypothetical protein
VEHVKVHIPVVVTVKVSPAVVTIVGTVGQEVVRTSTAQVVNCGVHVSTVTQGVGMVNVWLQEVIVVGAVVQVTVNDLVV